MTSDNEGRRSSGLLRSRGSLIALLWMFAASPVLLLRFPELTYRSGGVVFLMVSLGILVLIGAPIFLTETALGSMMRGGLPNALRKLEPRSEFVGWLALSSLFHTAMFVAVVTGWSLTQVGLSLANDLQSVGLPDPLSTVFPSVLQSPLPLVGVVILWIGVYAVARQGVRGMEKMSILLLPFTVLIATGLGIYGVATLDALDQLLSPRSSLDPAHLLKSVEASVVLLGLGLGVLTSLTSKAQEKAETSLVTLVVPLMVFALAVLATLMTAFIDLSSSSTQGVVGTILILPTTASALGNHVFFLLLSALLVVMGFSTLIPMITAVSHELADKFGMTRERASGLTSIFGLAASFPYVWWLDTSLTPVEDGLTAGIRLMAGTEVYLLFIGPAVIVVLLLGTILLSLKPEEVVGHSNFVSGIRLPGLYRYLLLAAAGVGSLLLLAGVIDRLASLFLRGPVTGIDIISLVYWIVPVVLATGLLTASRGWTEKS